MTYASHDIKGYVPGQLFWSGNKVYFVAKRVQSHNGYFMTIGRRSC